MRQWYVVQTKHRRENEAVVNLQRQGFEAYLPLIQVSKRRRGKWQPVVEPLFPRYLFVYVDPDSTDITPIRSTLGVSQMVKFGHELVPLPDNFIDYLKSMENDQTGCYAREQNTFEKGEQVKILDGPLAGFHGVYEAESSQDRVIILLNILGSAKRFNIKSAQVAKATS